jgi:hypothetical protein
VRIQIKSAQVINHILFQWASNSGGAVLLIDEVPQGMRNIVRCNRDGNDTYMYPPVYTRFEPYRDEIISAAKGNVDNQ